MAKADRLTSQLVHVADIVGDLGLNIAKAQRAMDLNYINEIKAKMLIVADTLGTLDETPPASGAPKKEKEAFEERQKAKPAQQAAIMAFLNSIPPSRYQYTKTNLDFSADLAETKQISGSANLKASFKVLAVNAAMTLGYGHDYRASARISTTLDAYQEPGLANQLMENAKNIGASGMKLPENFEFAKEIVDGAKEIGFAVQGKDKDGKIPPKTV